MTAVDALAVGNVLDGAVAGGDVATALGCGAGSIGGAGNSNRRELPSPGIATLGSLEIASFFGPVPALADATTGATLGGGAALCITGNGSPG